MADVVPEKAWVVAVVPGMRTIVSHSEDTACILDISRVASPWGHIELSAQVVQVDVVAQAVLVAVAKAAKVLVAAALG